MNLIALPNRPFRRQPDAFTLIELLVVIAVIGILAALLLPTLSKTKNRAVEIIDVNNLKQINTAAQLYATDSLDNLPWPNWKSGDYSGRPGWLYALDASATGPAQFKIEEDCFGPR